MDDLINQWAEVGASYLIAQHDDELVSWNVVQETRQEVQEMLVVVLRCFERDRRQRVLEPSDN